MGGRKGGRIRDQIRPWRGTGDRARGGTQPGPDLLVKAGRLPPGARPPLPGGADLGGQVCSVSTPVCLHTLSAAFIPRPSPTLSPFLPSWAGALVTHGLGPLSRGQSEELTAVVPFAPVLKPSMGGRRENLLAVRHQPALRCLSRASAPGWVPQVAFWVLHVGAGVGQPSLTSWGTLSSLFCHHPRALPQPLPLSPVRKVSAEALRGRQPRGGTWGLHWGGRKRERKGSFSPEPPPPLPSTGSQPSLLSPPRLVRGGCEGVRWGGRSCQSGAGELPKLH